MKTAHYNLLIINTFILLQLGCLVVLANQPIKEPTKTDSLLALRQQYKKDKNWVGWRKVSTEAANIYQATAQWEKWYQARKGIVRTFFRTDKLDSALISMQHTTQQLGALPDSLNQWSADAYNIMASITKRMGQSEQQENYLYKALQFAQQKADTSTQIKALNGLMSLMDDKGDYHQIITYGQQALPLLKSPAGSTYRTNTYNNLALGHRSLGEYDTAVVYFKRSLAIDSTRERTISFLALTHNDNANYEQAIKLFKKRAKLITDDSLALINNYRRLGIAYGGQEKYKEVEAAFQQAEQLIEATQETDEAGALYVCWGDALLDQNKAKKAAEFYHKALHYSLPNFPINTPLKENPATELCATEIWAVQALLNKGNAFFEIAQQSQQATDYTTALTSLETALTAAQIRTRDNQSQSALFLTDYYFPARENCLMACERLYQLTKDQQYLEKAFEITQKSKAMLTLGALQEDEAKVDASIPDSLLAQDQALKDRLQYLQEQIYDGKLQQQKKEVYLLQDSLLKTQKAHADFVHQMERNYPAYHELKYADQYVSSARIQQDLLGENQALLAYFMGDSLIFLQVISPNQQRLYTQAIPKDFQKLIIDFRKSATDFRFFSHADSSLIAYQLYAQSAHRLYDLLLKKAVEDFDPSVKELLIVPDGLLGYIPFEALLLQPPPSTDRIAYHQLDYLFQHYPIHYAYSTPLLWKSFQRTRQKAAKLYAGFAPIYDAATASQLDSIEAVVKRSADSQITLRSGWNDLPNARKSVTKISQQFKGDAYLEKAATEAQFKALASDYRILHLAMHGWLNDRNPSFSSMIFSQDQQESKDGNLNVLEICNLQLQADLVVLGACNTGFGAIERGEGIMSLNRAFAYAGCPSMVMSLWSVPDQETSRLMEGFFQHLYDGQAIHTALRAAKLAYLEDPNVTPMRMHPFFWAGFVTSGDYRAVIQASNGSWWWLGLLGLGVVGVLGWGMYRSRQSSK